MLLNIVEPNEILLYDVNVREQVMYFNHALLYKCLHESLKAKCDYFYYCTVSCTVPGVHLVMYTNICITKTFANNNSKFIHNKD
jgi:hypothetical protein